MLSPIMTLCAGGKWPNIDTSRKACGLQVMPRFSGPGCPSVEFLPCILASLSPSVYYHELPSLTIQLHLSTSEVGVSEDGCHAFPLRM